MGLRRLVISEVASLESLKTADIVSGNLRTIELNEKIVDNFKNIKGVKTVEPLIALVGKAEFKGSSFDLGIFGASPRYLELSDIEPIYGEFYGAENKEGKIQKEEKEVGREGEVLPSPAGEAPGRPGAGAGPPSSDLR